MRAPTARVVDPGGSFWTGRRLFRLRKNQLGIVCEVCEWWTAIPIRFGYDHADDLRAIHLRKAHSSEIIAGTVAWRLPREGIPG